MSPPDDIRDLLDDPSSDEVAELEHVDALLRSVDAPPPVPAGLWPAVNRAARRERPKPRRLRPYRVVVLTAALVAVGFAIGYLVTGTDGSSDLDVFDHITLTAVPGAPANAVMEIDVLPIDDAGNWRLLAQVTGLPPLAANERYELWLTKNGEAVASCGLFTVDEAGAGRNVWFNAPYSFRDFDDWTVVRVGPGGEQGAPLLTGAVTAPV